MKNVWAHILNAIRLEPTNLFERITLSALLLLLVALVGSLLGRIFVRRVTDPERRADWRRLVAYICATLAIALVGFVWLPERIVLSLTIVAGVILVRLVANLIVAERTTDLTRRYHWRQAVTYFSAVSGIFALGLVWFEQGAGRLTTFLGLVSAGLAVAMHDTIANLTGWIFIMWRKPFSVGDRIEIDGIAGDVIDVRVFEFSVIEIGNWVDAEQSTGRIVHIPNGKVLRSALANYETGFAYVWHEIPVLITFESHWQDAKRILLEIAMEKTEQLSENAQDQIRRAASRYLIFYNNLKPTVYVTVRDCGVLLTIRYIVSPRKRRTSEQDVWEAILVAFAARDDIDFAYPTTRFYDNRMEGKAGTIPARESGNGSPAAKGGRG